VKNGEGESKNPLLWGKRMKSGEGTFESSYPQKSPEKKKAKVFKRHLNYRRP